MSLRETRGGSGGYFGKVRGDKIVQKILDDLQIASLDYVVMSHFDSDHLGGLVGGSQGRSLIWSLKTKGRGAKKQYVNCKATGLFPKRALVDMGPPVRDPHKALRREWEACAPVLARKHNIEHIRIVGKEQMGTVLDLGGGVTAKIVAGRGWTVGATERDPLANSPNENSLALLIENLDDFSFLVTGDLIGQEYPIGGIEDATLEKSLANGLRETREHCYGLDVLRVGHHGAGNATEASFVKAMCPQVAIISTGDNKHGHPHCNTLNTLSSAKIPLVLQTEAGKTKATCKILKPRKPVIAYGTIHVEVSGSVFSVSNFGIKSEANNKATKVFMYTYSAKD